MNFSYFISQVTSKFRERTMHLSKIMSNSMDHVISTCLLLRDVLVWLNNKTEMQMVCSQTGKTAVCFHHKISKRDPSPGQVVVGTARVVCTSKREDEYVQ